ncbi:MAG TPA: hypothetical protein VMX38_05195 [Verrucomicrobiae bacterium]|nr:hypothetical protein [Verrucomicrobiae bacterium]
MDQAENGHAARQNTNTKVLEAIVQRVRNDIVASTGPQQVNLRMLTERIAGVRPGQEKISNDPSASTFPDRAIGTEMFSVLSMNSASAAG